MSPAPSSGDLYTRNIHVINLTTSVINTAVPSKNISPDLVLEYRILSPNIAFWNIRVKRLIYFNFLMLVVEFELDPELTFDVDMLTT